MRRALFFILLAAAASLTTAAPTLYPGEAPGAAKAKVAAGKAKLANKAFCATYTIEGSGVTFSGLKAADGSVLLEGGTPLFSIHLKNGKILDSTNMKANGLSLATPKENTAPASPQPAPPAPAGPKVLQGMFVAPDGSLAVMWSGILDDNSHYLRHRLNIRSKKPLEIDKIIALDYQASREGGTPNISGNTSHGCVVVNNKLFFGLETPMSLMTAGGKGGAVPTTNWNPAVWHPDFFTPAFNYPRSFKKAYGNRYAETNGPVLTHLKQAEGVINFQEGGNCSVTFQYRKGRNDLNILGVQLLDANGQLLSEDVHEGRMGQEPANNTYRLTIPQPGSYRLRYWAQTRDHEINSLGRINYSLPLGKDKARGAGHESTRVEGIWQRETALRPGQTWSVTSVVGLLAPGQERRSFLAYIERERAVPYRPFVHYNDWYEIGIRVHDNKDPRQRTSEAMWLKLLDTWNRELCTKRHTKLDAFIVDDGWDNFNSLWDFHCGFPNGFAKLAQKARKQGAGIGTWLGPVGGYGSSKQMRLSYWNSKHPSNKIDNFQLSNPEYFNAFVGRCRKMIKDYHMRYFKFDGISTNFHSMGPGAIEDAEGILNVIHALRQTKKDVFINATVGTWASPFWYMHADSIWRQENDFDQMGTAGDPRDRWITYRDRLVHEVFVKGAPLCPINSLMTHGTIITKNGPPHIMSREPENCRKEMRMAFGCGSALQEIYADNDLLSQKGGILWDELAACIAWVRRNADVLPDVHWVGGSPWNGSDGSIYGYAAWNKEKATLTLRNSSDEEKTLRTTLREVLDIPPGVKGSVTFRNSFDDQRSLPEFTDQAVDADAPITLTLKPQEVLVMEGTCAM